MTKKFSIKEAIKFGWNITKKHFFFFIGLFLFIGVIEVGVDMLLNSAGENDFPSGIINFVN